MVSRDSNDDSPGDGLLDRGAPDRTVMATLLQAVERLMAEFAYRIDFEQGFTIAELFSPDGYYESDGKRSTGRAAIHQAYVRRAARGPRTSRHLFTNVRVERLPDEKYGATAIMLLFARDGDGLHPAVPLSVADVTAVYASDGMSADSGLPRIASRTLRTIFADENESPVLPLGQET